MVTVSILLSFFYVVVVSWSLWYLSASLFDPLEWGRCGHWYNTPLCVGADVNLTSPGLSGEETEGWFASSTSSVEEYWTRNVLEMQGKDWSNYVGLSLTFSSSVLQPASSVRPGSSTVAVRADPLPLLVPGVPVPRQRGALVWKSLLLYVGLPLRGPRGAGRTELLPAGRGRGAEAVRDAQVGAPATAGRLG